MKPVSSVPNTLVFFLKGLYNIHATVLHYNYSVLHNWSHHSFMNQKKLKR